MAKKIDLSESTKLLQESDDKLDALYNSVMRVKEVSGKMRDEITSHKPIFDNLGKDVDTAAHNLYNKNKAMDVVIEEKNKCCGMLPYYVTIGVQIIVIILIVVTWNTNKQTN